MAAYAAVVSLMKVIDDIETHPSPPIFLDKQQVESLTKTLVSLQEFLESYNSPFAYSDEADPLEMRIVDVAHAVEDAIDSYKIDTIQLSAAAATHAAEYVIESYIIDTIQLYVAAATHTAVDVIESYVIDTIQLYAAAAAATDDGGDEQISCIHFYQELHNVIEEMDMIKKEVNGTGITREKVVHQRNVAGSRSSFTEKNPIMVGFDDVLDQLRHKLTDENINRQIIPIVGMGGIGKTTLAKGAFEHELIKYRFDICVWTAISQDYNIVETLREVLSRAGEPSSSTDEKDLQVELRKCLWGRRYLIILDDIWNIDVWDELKFSFPDRGNGSRIVVTTRMSNLAAHLTDDSCYIFNMGFLDMVSSWTLFSKTIYGEQSFPTQLEKIGKKIVEKCKGLPLAIVVIGGLMAKSEPTLEYWVHIEKNISSMVNSENDDYCLRILKLSYNYLPAYLKPCFLYMGVFEEDRVIRASTIVEQWISEGFLKPVDNKSLTTIAIEYLKELVDRNLILVHELGIVGNVKSCKIHDLLRDLSMKEAQKQRFLCVLREQSPEELISQHRIIIPGSTSKEKIGDALDSMSHARSFVSQHRWVKELPNSRFLRTLYGYIGDDVNITTGCRYSLDNVFHLVNSRYLAFVAKWGSVVPPINMLWNLHTLNIRCWGKFIAPIEIWKMHKLRHVDIPRWNLHLPDPPSNDNDIIIMENLEVLKRVVDFNLSEDVVKRIPNIKKLKVLYSGELVGGVNSLGNLQCLSKLESLELWVMSKYGVKCMLNLSFPPFLKKLNLDLPYDFEWQEILPTIGCLPLHKLRLGRGRFRTGKWETTEGQFPNLKSLTLSGCYNLENWTVLESSHLPPLQDLHLQHITRLKEIPSEIGEIPTLKTIEVNFCNKSVVLSAKQILEEQEKLRDQLDLHVKVKVWKEYEALEELATSNFQFRVV